MHRLTVFPHFRLLCDQPDGAGGGGAGVATPPAPVAPPAASAPGPAPSGPASGVPGQSAGTPGSAAAAAARKFEYDEDRSDWVPSHRLRETREQFEKRLEAEQRKVRALAGAEEPGDPRKAQLLQSLRDLDPRLAELLDGKLSEGVEAASRREEEDWQRHGLRMVNQGVTAWAKVMGRDAKALGARGQQFIMNELRQFIGADRSGERNRRYEQGDPTLIDDLVADMQGYYVDPVRQASTTTAATAAERNRRLPSTGPVGGIPPTAPGEKPKGKAVHEAARQAFNQSQGRTS